jgi:hypothetical protein
MPNVSSDVAVGAPNPAPVDSGRTTPVNVNFGELAGNVASIGAMVPGFMAKRAMGQAASAIESAAMKGDYGQGNVPDAYAPGIPGGGTSMPGTTPADPHAVAAAAATDIASSTGIPPSPGMQGALVEGAQAKSTFDDMVSQNVRNQNARDIFIATKTNDLLQRYPMMAPQIMQVMGQADAFSRQLYQNQHGAQQAYIENQMNIAKDIQQKAHLAGYSDFDSMTPGQILSNYQSSQFWKNHVALEQGKDALQIQQDGENMGISQDRQKMLTTIDKVSPAIMDGINIGGNQIMQGINPLGGPALTTATQKAEAMQVYMTHLHAQVLAAVPGSMRGKELSDRMGWMDEQAKLYGDLIGGGIAATVAKTRLDTQTSLMTSAVLDKYPFYKQLEMAANVVRAIPPGSQEAAMQSVVAPAVAAQVGSMLGQQAKGPVNLADLGITNPNDPTQVANHARGTSIILSAQMQDDQWKNLDETHRAGVVAHVVDNIRSSINSKTDGHMDQLMDALSDPSMKNIVGRKDFQDNFNAPEAAVFGRYTANMGSGLFQGQPELHGKTLQPGYGPDGVLGIVIPPDATTGQRAALQTFNVKAGKTVRAISQMTGMSVQEANVWFASRAFGSAGRDQ